MKQKFKLFRKNKELIIQEYNEIESEKPSLLCEESYDINHLISIIQKKPELIVKTLRSNNLYPPSAIITSLVNGVKDLLLTNASINHKNSTELTFNDKELNHDNEIKDQTINNNDSKINNLDIDKILEDGFDDKNGQKLQNEVTLVKNVNSSKIKRNTILISKGS